MILHLDPLTPDLPDTGSCFSTSILFIMKHRILVSLRLPTVSLPTTQLFKMCTPRVLLLVMHFILLMMSAEQQGFTIDSLSPNGAIMVGRTLGGS